MPAPTTYVHHPRHPELQVDLSFHPVVNDSPRQLTKEQIRFFNEHGYLLGIRLYSREEIERIFQFCEGPLTERMKTDAAAKRSNVSYHAQLPEVCRIATQPLLLNHLRDLIGPNIICQVSQYICKRPGDAWPSIYHQDASFNPLSHAKSVVVWLALQDVDEGNGCMRFLAGSHRGGHLPCAGPEAPHRFEIDQPERYGSRVSVELAAGEAVIFSDLLVHGAPPNPSPTRLRPGFTFTFCSADVVPYKDWDRMSILCCGEDRNHNWRVNPRAGDRLTA